MVILLGINKDDDYSNFDKAINRLLKMRLWDQIENIKDKKKSWNTNVVQNNFEILVVP